MAANSTVLDLVWPNFLPIREFMSALVICKNEEDSIKNEDTGVVTTFLPL